MLVQMLYGIWTNSLGLISDAIHMAFDCMAIGVGLIASVMARWAPNERFTYGYGRIETLSGFSNGVFLILISIFIVFEAIERLMNPPEMNTSQLLLVTTHGHSHHHSHENPHSHSHSHSHSHLSHHHASSHGPNLHDHSQIHDPAHEGHSHNMRGVFLHVMADTLGSVGVIISTLLIQFYGWTGFDPIASLFIAILIAASVIPLVIDTGKVLMLDLDHRASGIEKALTELHQVDGVASYSSPRFWPKDDSNVIGSIHISVSPAASSHDPTGPHHTVQGRFQQVDRVIERVDSLLRSRISGLEELTVQVEGAPSRSP
ncbi:hypothetical protein PHLGIDRAFT_74196 [Phlebiopsis gigantea 11061_1 CR5-6]|uniref:Cation efflux protein transmembrane domain-containing protein n=1 Tax=Phlebiopsis gigantea (strain 11061_1 CR5-6) TaxID=745531 RepID=A0A0C3S593_PHLG1|nr:hypothetical protein PHLGIDRAFT_74196 [Phlebiopsis gigantea 11061_1 CR5-6]